MFFLNKNYYQCRKCFILDFISVQIFRYNIINFNKFHAKVYLSQGFSSQKEFIIVCIYIFLLFRTLHK